MTAAAVSTAMAEVLGSAAAANGPFPYSTSMSLAMNVDLPLATNVMNWPSTIAANYRNFVNMDANDKTFTIITGVYNNLEQVAIGLGSEGIGAVSKLGMFADYVILRCD